MLGSRAAQDTAWRNGRRHATAAGGWRKISSQGKRKERDRSTATVPTVTISASAALSRMSDSNSKPATSQRKRPRSELETPASSSSSPEDDGVFAFESALTAELAAGKSVRLAIRSLFEELGTHPSSTDNGQRQRLQRLNLAGPILAALDASPDLAEDVHTLAQMCQAVYDFAEDEIDALRSPRTRLDLGLTALDDVSRLIHNANNVIVLSGAGVSVSCGIPDFRSKGGLYDTVLERFGLTDPQAIFDLQEFILDPRLFYSFAKDVMPSKDLKPSPTHAFVAELERRGKLLRNYSQNIDGLERRAGVSDDGLVLCHGSFLTATCMRPTCRVKIPGSEIVAEVAAGTVPLCRKCGNRPVTNHGNDEDDDENDLDAQSMGVLKPDIVFFGENLPKKVGESLEKDLSKADLLLVLGTSLQVAPVAKIPHYFKEGVPRILVNRELVSYDFDVELLGNCDAVVAELRRILGWSNPPEARIADNANGVEDHRDANLEEGKDKSAEESKPFTFCPPRRFLFAGASDNLVQQSSQPGSEGGSREDAIGGGDMIEEILGSSPSAEAPTS